MQGPMNPLNKRFRLADAVVEPALNRIIRGTEVIVVERQVMRILVLLASHIDEVVSREEMHSAIWPDTTPNDEGLTQAVSKLRKALGDTPQQGKRIQTIRKVGYRLRGPLAPVQQVEQVRQVPPRVPVARAVPQPRAWKPFASFGSGAAACLVILYMLRVGVPAADSWPSSADEQSVMRIRMAVPEAAAHDLIAGLDGLQLASLDSLAYRATYSCVSIDAKDAGDADHLRDVLDRMTQLTGELPPCAEPDPVVE